MSKTNTLSVIDIIIKSLKLFYPTVLKIKYWYITYILGHIVATYLQQSTNSWIVFLYTSLATPIITLKILSLINKEKINLLNFKNYIILNFIGIVIALIILGTFTLSLILIAILSTTLLGILGLPSASIIQAVGNNPYIFLLAPTLITLKSITQLSQSAYIYLFNKKGFWESFWQSNNMTKNNFVKIFTLTAIYYIPFMFLIILSIALYENFKIELYKQFPWIPLSLNLIAALSLPIFVIIRLNIFEAISSNNSTDIKNQLLFKIKTVTTLIIGVAIMLFYFFMVLFFKSNI